ncbi:uncharacterized protein LOC134842724 [Symsagittifera roscoffensis]|uniref:uncharacterized protein LOC134842724 n=1 Tax=Symsagittifera roscoffensis TaxID=84072 RepID=UPI00307C4E9C
MIRQLNPHSSVDIARLSDENKQDYLFIFAVLPLICMARYCCEKIGQVIFLSSEAANKIRTKPKAFKLAVKKFEEATWKCAYYGFVATYGIVFLSWEPFLTDLFQYPNQVTPKITVYYIVQISFYLWMTVCLLWGDVRMKDFYQMTTHHIATLCLLFLSYSFHLTHGGCLLMLLMDIADPFLELGKIFKYLEMETASLISFVMFLTSFIFLRIFLYPVYALYPCIVHTWDLALFLDRRGVYYAIDGFMVVLFCLNVYWAVLIIKVLVNKLISGKMKDCRSDDEMD